MKLISILGLALALAGGLGAPSALAAGKEVSCFGDGRKDADALMAACDKVIAHSSGRSILAPAYAVRAQVWSAKHDYDRAIQDYDRAIEMNPRDMFLVMNRASALANKGDLDGAMAGYDRAIQMDPRFSYPYLNRASLWLRRGDRQKALQDYDQAYARDIRSPTTMNGACWARAVLGVDLDRALVLCNGSLKDNPRAAAFLDSRALVHLRRGEFTDAVSDADLALQDRPGLAASLLVRGIAKRRLGRAAEADADLAAAEALEHGIAERYAGWGVTP